MRTLRYNIYSKIHKDLRIMLLDAGLKIQKTDFSQPEETRETLVVIQQVLHSFEYHAMMEDNLVFHALATAAPYIVATFENVNAKNQKQAGSVLKLISKYEQLGSKAERINLGHNLQVSFFEFTASVLQNMSKEETVLNELLWLNYTDAELTEMEKEILDRLSPEDTICQTGRILKNMPIKEIITWIKNVAENAAPLAADKLLKTAKAVLPAEKWDMIRGEFRMPQAAA